MSNYKKSKLSKSLCIDEIKYYFSMLDEQIVDYDCALLCKESNNGIPYCCEAGNAVPLLYRAEYEYLCTLGDLWFEWKPKNEEDSELLDYARDDQIFAECCGVEHCVRAERSITCRIFPLEPYIDRRGVFVALTFLEDFMKSSDNSDEPKCPLVKRRDDIRIEFIDSHFLFWQNLLLRLPSEYQIYKSSSSSIRKLNKNQKTDPILFFPSFYKDIESMREFI